MCHIRVMSCHVMSQDQDQGSSSDQSNVDIQMSQSERKARENACKSRLILPLIR